MDHLSLAVDAAPGKLFVSRSAMAAISRAPSTTREIQKICRLVSDYHTDKFFKIMDIPIPKKQVK